jgi:hypothetical protein
MQGPKENILTFTEKLLAFKDMIQVWKEHPPSVNIEMFPLPLQIQDQSDSKEVVPLIISHLQSPTDSLDQCFPFLSSEMYDCVRNRFVGFSQNSLSSKRKSNLLNYRAIEL